MAWSPNADNVLLTVGENLLIKSMTPAVKPIQVSSKHPSLVVRVLTAEIVEGA
jgi:hypothetical protein